MDSKNLENLFNLTSSIGLTFDITPLAYSLDLPLQEIINFFQSDKGKSIFEKIDDTRFKFKDIDFKAKILSKLSHNEKIQNKNKYKRSLIEKMQEFFKDIYINESEKLNRDRILSFFLYFTYYVIYLDYLDLAEQNIDFILQRMYPKIEDYEKALIAKAHLDYKKKDFQSAIKNLNKIKIYPEQILRKYNFLTSIYFITGDEKDCDNIYKEWEKFNKFMTFFNKARINLNKVSHLLNKNKYNDALETLKKIEPDFINAEKEFNYIYLYTMIGDLYNSFGLIYFELSDFEKAKDYFFQSIEYYKKCGFDRDLVVPYNNIAEIYKQNKQYNKAINIYKNIINISRTLGNKQAYGISLWNIGEIYFDYKNYEKAESYFERGSNIIFKTVNYPSYEDYFKLYFAKLYYETKRFKEAEEIINQILLSSHERGEEKIYGESLLIKGKIIAHRGEDPKSFFEEAITIFEKLHLDDLLKEAKKLRLMYY